MHRFIVREGLAVGARVRLSDEEAAHAFRVLRLRAGEEVELGDGEGKLFSAELTEVSREQVTAEVREELDYLLSVREEACKLTDMANRGELPLRVTHNDTKINNVLFSPIDKRAMVVVDLDTVMPGLVGHDFGDAIRFAANREPEDSRNLENVGLNMDVYRAFSEGFLEQTAGTLTQNEIDTLASSCLTLTVELATRFLADYILGDPYFNTSTADHNLVRTRCQIALAKDMQKNLPAMEECIRSCVNRMNVK